MPFEELSLDRIADAAVSIDPVFRNSPQYVDDQLSDLLGREVVLKVETANPIRSFKGRGVDYLVRGLPDGSHLVAVSTGNFGQAVAYVGRGRGFAVDVFVPDDVNPAKLARMERFGARVTTAGADSAAAMDRALDYLSRTPNAVLVKDGRDLAITEGAGSIGVELLHAGPYDSIVVQVGDGALIAGIARWVKAHAPETRVIGVCATGAQAMVESWRAGRSIPSGPLDTIADGMAIRVPIPESVDRMRGLIDEFVLVDDTDLLDAMRLAANRLGLLLEPAGAAGLAASRKHDIPGGRSAVVLTGGNLRPELAATLLG